MALLLNPVHEVVFSFRTLTDALKDEIGVGHSVFRESIRHAEIIYDLHGGDDLQAVHNDLLVRGQPFS